jgi:hypothetical protein
MFDRSTYITPPSVNINVKQQPNDAADAARLYGECKAKAEKEVAEATIVKFGAHNELTGVKVDSMRSFIDNKVHVRLLFKINGETFDIHVEDSDEARTVAGYREVACKLFDKVILKMLPPGFQAQRDSKL